MTYNILLTLHIISVIGLLGIGGGSAFYKFMADRSKNLDVIVHTNKMVVLADWLFTTPAVLAQPITGVMLANFMGYSFDAYWLELSVNLYVFSIILWLVAVWLQVLMKRMAIKAQKKSTILGDDYYRLVTYWIWLGIFSVLGMGTVFYFMIFKTMN
jgi:uncharacterized membrane protein